MYKQGNVSVHVPDTTNVDVYVYDAKTAGALNQMAYGSRSGGGLDKILWFLGIGMFFICVGGFGIAVLGSQMFPMSGQPTSSQTVNVQSGPCLVCVNTGDVITTSDNSEKVDSSSHDVVTNNSQTCNGGLVGTVCISSNPSSVVSGNVVPTPIIASSQQNLATLPQIDDPYSTAQGPAILPVIGAITIGLLLSLGVVKVLSRRTS